MSKSFKWVEPDITFDNWCDECDQFREEHRRIDTKLGHNWKTCVEHKTCLAYQHQAHQFETQVEEEIQQIDENLLLPNERERYPKKPWEIKIDQAHKVVQEYNAVLQDKQEQSVPKPRLNQIILELLGKS